MKNIEFKARCPDPPRIRETLRKQGVLLEVSMRQVDTYFRVPAGRLKLREIDQRHAELIHYHRGDAASARESDYIIAPVAQADTLREALDRALGVRVVVSKTRDLYLWKNTRVHLDEVDGLGSFLELETVVGGQGLEKASDECASIQAALGISDSDILAVSYVDLLEARNK